MLQASAWMKTMRKGHKNSLCSRRSRLQKGTTAWSFEKSTNGVALYSTCTYAVACKQDYVPSSVFIFTFYRKNLENQSK